METKQLRKKLEGTAYAVLHSYREQSVKPVF